MKIGIRFVKKNFKGSLISLITHLYPRAFKNILWAHMRTHSLGTGRRTSIARSAILLKKKFRNNLKAVKVLRETNKFLKSLDINKNEYVIRR